MEGTIPLRVCDVKISDMLVFSLGLSDFSAQLVTGVEMSDDEGYEGVFNFCRIDILDAEGKRDFYQFMPSHEVRVMRR